MLELLFYLGGIAVMMLFAALWEQASRRADRYRRELEAANEVCRACAMVVERRGRDTNWIGLNNWLARNLRRQHEVLHHKADGITK